MASTRATKSGLSRDTQNKINAKYDPELAYMCLEWMKDLINANLQAGDDVVNFSSEGEPKNFSAALKDGVVLARMANILVPDSIPKKKYEKTPKLPFKQMELIELFIKACKNFGVAEQECFQTCDLYEEQNLFQVVVCLQSLGRKAKAKGLKGFGPKEADSNKREFSEDVLRAGTSVIGLQYGTNKGASQSGMNFGKSRSILD